MHPTIRKQLILNKLHSTATGVPDSDGETHIRFEAFLCTCIRDNFQTMLYKGTAVAGVPDKNGEIRTILEDTA